MVNQNVTADTKRILVVAAHPDDIEFVAAGTLLHSIDAGAEVYFCIVTNGAAGSNDPSVSEEDITGIRQAEQREAAAVLGVQDVIFLNYPDGILQPTMELRRDLTRVVRQIKPFRVFAPDPTYYWDVDYLNHPDHRAVGEAAAYAVFPSAETFRIFPELISEGYQPHHVSEIYLTTPAIPNLTVDISATMERKINALLCHKSQKVENMVPLIKEWDQERGQKIGCEFAEDFRTIIFF